MAEAFPQIVLSLADNIRHSLQRANDANNLEEIRSILTEIKRNVDELVAVAKSSD